MRDGYYHTGDVASRDADGYITYVGRTDDVFKARDYRISPFELESVLIEHAAVAEAAVVPSPDPVRLAVPKAYVVLAAGHEPTPRPRGDPGVRARAPRAVQAHPPAGVRRAAQDDLRQDPPGGAARPRGGARRRGPPASTARRTSPTSRAEPDGGSLPPRNSRYLRGAPPTGPTERRLALRPWLISRGRANDHGSVIISAGGRGTTSGRVGRHVPRPVLPPRRFLTTTSSAGWEFREEHLALARAARARGERALAGAFTDPADAALLVWSTDDRAVVEAFVEQDPYVRQRSRDQPWRIREWNVVVGGSLSQ